MSTHSEMVVMRAWGMVVVGVLALAGCGSQAADPPAPAAATRPVPTMDTIAWAAAGNDPANDGGQNTTVAYSASGKDGSQGDPQRQIVFGMPMNRTDTLTHQAQRSLWMEAIGAPGENVSCSITVNGQQVVSNAGTATVDCRWSGTPT